MFGKDRKGRRSGFTMAEVLTVVAIVGILAAIAIPSVITYQRALKLTELDDNARTIYLAAQNNLAALRSASGDTLETGGGRAADVTTAGVAIPGSGTDWKYVSTNELSSTDPDWLVLPGSVDSALMEANSYYLVEFDPASGVVYGVFYSETKSGTRGAPLSAGNYKALCDNACRTRAGRNTFATDSGGFWVGYYGADGALDLTRPDAQKLPIPKLKLTNAEELALEFNATAESGVDTQKVFYAVSVSDGANAKTLVAQGKFNDGKTNTVVLDTLKSTYSMAPGASVYDGWTVGASFSNWVKEPAGGWAVTPGSDVTVTVTTWYQPDSGEGLTALPQSASVTTNSLFAARNGETAHIAYGRHLQNLDPGTSNVDGAVTAAKQIREIDFNATGDATRYYWKSCYADKKFTPIGNTSLTHYDGQGFLIRNLDAAAPSGKNAGLFETLDAATVESVTLVDAKASASGQSAGALAGVARSNTQVKDCQVYITATGSVYSAVTRISAANAGGLIGWAQGCAVENSFASTVAHGTQNTGGLVGRSGGNVNLKTSYAAGRLSGPRVGGLVGDGNGVTMTDCYAAGLMLPDANGAAAGLCAAEVTSATRCYAAADYTTQAGTSYSIVGAVPGGSCNSVYYLAKSGVNDAATVAGVEQVNSGDQLTKDAGGKLASFTAFKTSAAKTYPYNHVTRTEEEGPLKSPYPYPALGELPHYGDWLEATAPTVSSLVAYYERYDVALNEWQSETKYEFFCYVNGEARNGLSARTGAIPAEGYAFLSTEKLAAQWTSVGEATYLQVNLTGADTVTGVELLATPMPYGSFALTEDLTPTTNESEAAYFAYVLPRSGLEQVRPAGGGGSYCTKLDITPVTKDWSGNVTETKPTTTAWVNPLFGKAAYNGKAPGSSQVFAVRSLRHLNNISGFYGSQTYVQELDVDGSVYRDDLAFNADGNATAAGMELRVTYDNGATWVPYNRTDWIPNNSRVAFSPICETDAAGVVGSFNSDYDGSNRTISHLIIGSRHVKTASEDNDYAGLFSRTMSGTVRNVNIDSCQVIGMTNEAANSSGVLIGRLSGTVENCTVTNSTVTAQGTKAGGHVGGLVGYVNDGGTITGCSVEDTAVTGGSFSYNAGGLAGYIYKQTAATKVQNCTVKNVQVTNQFSKETAGSVEKRGTAGGFVGCMKDNQGTIESCAVIGTGTLNISGASPYSGGFVGLMSNKAAGSIRGCGVRLEGKVKTGYDMQTISGGKYTGGFVGTLSAGAIQSSYAAVKVNGATAGGFAGRLEGGSVSNCYAGGHTKSGKYSAATLSVTGTSFAGGFAGSWKGGSLDTCYTTCAVSGPNEGTTDVFAYLEAETLNSPLPNCYAIGEAFVDGGKRGNLTKTNVATSMPKLDAAQRTQTYPYDTTLTTYPYVPVKYANGTSVPHYGDWPEEGGGRTKFEWDPIPEEFEPANLEYLQSAEAEWTESGLKLTIDTIGSGTTLDNLFARSGGSFTVSSDLGEVLNLKAESNGGAGSVRVTDGTGNVWEITPVVIATTPDGQPIRSYEFTIPLSSLPPYLKTLSVGGFKQGDMIDEIKYKGAAEGFRPVEPFLPGDSVVVDGKFDDWMGYPHQVLVYDPGNGDVAGTAIGAAFGDGNEIYLHIRNQYPPNMLSADQLPYTGKLTPLIITNLPITVKGDDNWNSYEFPWHVFTNLDYTGPGIYKLIHEKWGEVDGVWGKEEICQMECYLEVYSDGSQEIEMVIHLEAITGSEAAANKITTVTVKPALGGSLTIEREPPET